jgi:DNA repair protein RadC
LENATNSELLSRIAGKPEVAEALLRRYGGLTDLAKASFDELKLVTGIGQSRAAAIKSAFLLAQRLTQESYPQAPTLDTPARVADLLRESNRLYTVEHMQVVLLNTRRRLIAIEKISQGTLDTVTTHAREVFYPAVSRRASAIILVHNHPSGVMPDPVLCRTVYDSPMFR